MQKFKKIDQYQLMQIIGKGANGLVYKGLNTHNGSLVAVKQLFIGKSQVKSIKTQLDLLKELEHPSIVKFIDAIQKQNKIYLILEFIEGGSLAVLVRKSPLQEDVAKIYIKQVLNGLIFLHKKDVIHRDIKGANILLTKNGQIKLADFGVAVKLEENQKTISAAGSPYWMAPENISSSGDQPSVKCDIWSLGCTLIELLTGNPPYYDLMQFPAMFRIVEDEHPPLPTCSPQCNQFLLACFIKDPKKRPSSQQLINYSWLKDANQMKVANSIKQQVIVKQIQQALRPNINYIQLIKIIRKTKNSMLVCKNRYFQSIIYDNRNTNIHRIKLINQLVQNDDSSIQTLYKTNIINQEFQKFHHKFEFAEQFYLHISKFVTTVFQIYCKKVSEMETHHIVHSELDILFLLIIHVCIPSLSKLFVVFSKDLRGEQKKQLIYALFNFLSTTQNKSHVEPSSIILQIIQELQQKGGLKQIVNFNLCEEAKKQKLSINHLKIEIILKIIPSFHLMAEIRPYFKKYIVMTISQLLRNGLTDSQEQILLTKFMCLKQMVSSQFCKAELQKNGLIYHLSEYFGRQVENLEAMGMSSFFQSVLVLNQFIANSRNGVDKNRTLQLNRHQATKYLRLIYQFLHNKYKNSKKSIDSSFIQKLANLLQTLEHSGR